MARTRYKNLHDDFCKPDDDYANNHWTLYDQVLQLCEFGSWSSLRDLVSEVYIGGLLTLVRNNNVEIKEMGFTIILQEIESRTNGKV